MKVTQPASMAEQEGILTQVSQNLVWYYNPYTTLFLSFSFYPPYGSFSWAKSGQVSKTV